MEAFGTFTITAREMEFSTTSTSRVTPIKKALSTTLKALGGDGKVQMEVHSRHTQYYDDLYPKEKVWEFSFYVSFEVVNELYTLYQMLEALLKILAMRDQELAFHTLRLVPVQSAW